MAASACRADQLRRPRTRDELIEHLRSSFRRALRSMPSSGTVTQSNAAIPIMSFSTTTQNWHDIFFTSHDGLRLYARYYPAPSSGRRPLLCLPGLTRNSRDFHTLASFLCDPGNPHARDVLAIDWRGHGRSEWDPNPRNYALEMQMQDAVDLLTIAGARGVTMIGSCWGGLVAMMIACLRPGTISAVVLNDIGPVIEREGLVRMAALIGQVPLPATWDEAAQLVRDINARSFPSVPDLHWPEIARQLFNEDHGRPMPGYDPKLDGALSLIDGPMPSLWPQFDALARMPTMVIRGEHSDFLSQATFGDMQSRNPRLVSHTVRGQGHTPFLRDRSTIVAIAEFVRRAESGEGQDAGQSRLIA